MAAPKKTQKRMPRRREEFTYRGYKIDELKAMGISELLPLMPARARRKVVRGFSRGDETLLAKVRDGDEKIRTHLREMIVMPEMVGKSIEIYNDAVGINLISTEFAPESTIQEKVSFTRIDGSKSDFLPILNAVVEFWKNEIYKNA